MKITTSILVVILSIFYSISSVASNKNIYQNFEAKYSLEFSSMTVAKGVLYGELDNNTYKIYFKGTTTPFVSIFYSLKEIIMGAISINGCSNDMFYESIEQRPKRVKIIHATFPDKKTTKVTITKNNDKKVYLLKSKYNVFSPLSLYVFFMSNRIKIGKTYIRDVVVTKHLYKVSITALRKTTVNLDKLGRQRGKRAVIEVELKFYKIEKDGNVSKYKKVKKVVAWISTTPPFIPVLVKTWNFIGFFSARLTSLKLQ